MKNIFKNKSILITGASGSIGSALLKSLIKMNCKKSSIFVVGSLAIDTIKNLEFISKVKLFKKMSLSINLKTII